jgi:GT2 family glycosyltransferase
VNDSPDPLVSVITVNYNSKQRIDVILTCLKATLDLNWRPLQIIYIDNGSTDGSFEEIQCFARSNTPPDVEIVFLSLGYNAGFARANNEGFRISKSSKYVAILNNDLAPEPDSLDKLLTFLESEPRIAGVQPVVMDWQNSYIDSAGGLISSWGASAVAHGLDISSVTWPFYVSHIYGAYSVYRNDAIENSGGLFNPSFFMYGDDYELGVRLWASGYRLATLPVSGGRHFISATTGRFVTSSYYAARNETAVLVMYSGLPSMLVIMRTLGLISYTIVTRKSLTMRAFLDGLVFGARLRKSLPRFLKNALRLTPKPRLSLTEWFFMHTRLQTRPNFQKKLANEIMRRYHL